MKLRSLFSYLLLICVLQTAWSQSDQIHFDSIIQKRFGDLKSKFLTDSIIEDKYVGKAAALSKNYIAFKQFSDSVDLISLVIISEAQDPILKVYSLWGVLEKRNKTLALDIFKRCKDNKTQVYFLSGCTLSKRPLAVLLSQLILNYHEAKKISLSKSEFNYLKEIGTTFNNSLIQKDLEELKNMRQKKIN
jgi:protoporphyrinogen oxidase